MHHEVTWIADDMRTTRTTHHLRMRYFRLLQLVDMDYGLQFHRAHTMSLFHLLRISDGVWMCLKRHIFAIPVGSLNRSRIYFQYARDCDYWATTTGEDERTVDCPCDAYPRHPSLLLQNNGMAYP